VPTNFCADDSVRFCVLGRFAHRLRAPAGDA
jgi:hypothetical protein